MEQCCEVCHVQLGEDISSRPNAGYVIGGIPDIGESVTYRNLIQWAAGLMGTNAWFDWDGKLRFSWFENATGYTTTIDNRYSSDMAEDDIVISGITYTDLTDSVHIAGSDAYTLDLTGNYLMDQDTISEALSVLYVHLHAFQYRPFKASVVGAPYLWPMDRVTFTDKDGNGHVSSLTNVNFALNGATAIEAKGETAQRNKYAKQGAFTGRQKQALQVIQTATENHLNEAVQNATDYITGADGGHLRDIYDASGKRQEMVIMDTEDITTAEKVWRWDFGGLGFSSNGYGGPYGLAMTQDGSIVANFITSGTLDASLATITNINASNISTGTLSADRIAAASLALSKLTNEAQASIMSNAAARLQYYKSTSDQSPTGGSWQDTIPSWESGRYIWTRVATTKTYAGGSSTTSYSDEVYDENLTTAMSTAYAAAADASAASAAVNSAVVATVPVYYRSTTSTTPTIDTSTLIGTNPDTDNAWEYVMPQPKNGAYFYSCEKYTFVDGSVAFSTVRALANLTYTSLWASANNSTYIDGASIYAGSVTATQIDASTIAVTSLSGTSGIVASSTTKQQYYLSTSESSATGGSWGDTVPAYEQGKYIWTRTVTTNTMADGTSQVVQESAGVYDRNLTESLANQPVFNMLPTTYSREFASSKTWTNNGITWSVNPDGSVTATGTMTAGASSSSYQLTNNTTTADVPVLVLDPTRKYTVSGCPAGGGGSTYRIGVRANVPGSTPSGSGGTFYDDIGSGRTIPAGYKYAYVYIIIYSGATIPSGGLTFYPQFEVGDKAHAYSSTHGGSEAVAQRARSANTTATNALNAANSAVEQSQLIYISKPSGTTSVTAPTSWISDTSGAQDTWTLKRPVYSASYPVLFVATQTDTVGGSYECTTPMVDQTTTVIDGGHITTGTIDAGTVNVTNINASNITGGTINGAAVNAKLLNIVDANNNTVASFNDTVTIGNTSLGHSETDYNSFKLYDRNDNCYFAIGDERNSQGLATVEERFTGDGSETFFDLRYYCVLPVVSLTVNGTEVSEGDYSYDPLNGIVFRTAPADGDDIKIVYNTNEAIYRLDLGTRRSNTWTGEWSRVFGENCEASGYVSTAVGTGCISNGYMAKAIGQSCTASSGMSVAVGTDSVASGEFSYAVGDGTRVTNSYSIGLGAKHNVSGHGSVAIGHSCNISHKDCYALGRGLTSTNAGQVLLGQYNNTWNGGETLVEILGGGSSDGVYTTYTNFRTTNDFGDMWIQGDYSNASDKRLKTESGEVPDVSKIRAHKFKWNDKKPKHDDIDHVGYYAQDVEEVAPYFVSTGGDGYKALDYIGLLCAKVEGLERRVAELESKLKGES